MSDLIVHTDDYPAYHRQLGETVAEYEAFTEWCRIPVSSRSIGNLCRRTGFDARYVKRLHAKWQWETRAAAFDYDSSQLRPEPRSMDDEAALAGQMAAASMLLELGLNAISLKNPSLISADKAMKLVEKGVEIQRRALGQADLNVQFTVDDFSRVKRMMEEFGIEDAEIVDEEDGEA